MARSCRGQVDFGGSFDDQLATTADGSRESGRRLSAARTGAAGPVPGRRARPLSGREQEILRWLSSDLSLREIARQLFVSYDTMKTHTRHIYRKLGVSTRKQAVSQAWDGDIR